MKNKCLESFKHSVVLFLSLFILHAIVYMTKNMFSAAMASIVEDGVMTKSQTGAISAGFWFVYAISQVIGGFAADKYSPSKLIIIGLISGVISNAIIYVNQSYGVIMTVWCINAAFQFGLWPGVFKIVSTQIMPKFRGTAIFWVLLSTSAGQAISMLVASIVPKWQQNFIISSIALAVILVLWIVIYNNLEKQMIETEEVKSQIKDRLHEKTLGMKELSRISGLPVLLFISFMITATNNGIKMVTPVMLMESYENMPAAIATRMSIILIVFSTMGMFIANAVRVKVTKNEMKAVGILLAIGVPVLALSCFVGKFHYFTILALLSVAVAFTQGANPFTNSFAAARFTIYGRGGTISGILNAVAAVGNIFASYAFPRMSESMPWNAITAIWGISIIGAIVLAVCMIKLWTSFIEREHSLD